MNSIAKLLASHLLLLSIALTGCRHERMEDFPSEVKDILKLPVGEQRQAAEKLNLEDQWEVYWYGYFKIHPPLLHLAEPIADRGEEALGFLAVKIKDAENAVRLEHAIYPLVSMQRRGLVNLCEHPDLVRVVKEKMEELVEPDRVGFALPAMREIIENCNSVSE